MLLKCSETNDDAVAVHATEPVYSEDSATGSDVLCW